MISATEMLGGSGVYAPRENFKMIDAIWWFLMHYFDRLSLKSIFVIKNIDYTLYTWLCTLLLCVILLPEKFLKTCSS